MYVGKPIQIDKSMFCFNTSGEYKGSSFGAVCLHPLYNSEPAQDTLAHSNPPVGKSGHVPSGSSTETCSTAALAAKTTSQNRQHRAGGARQVASGRPRRKSLAASLAEGNQFTPDGCPTYHTAQAWLSCITADSHLADCTTLFAVPKQRRHTIVAPSDGSTTQAMMLDIAQHLHLPKGAFSLRELRRNTARRPAGLPSQAAVPMAAYAAMPQRENVELSIKPVPAKLRGATGVSALPPLTVTVRAHLLPHDGVDNTVSCQRLSDRLVVSAASGDVCLTGIAVAWFPVLRQDCMQMSLVAVVTEPVLYSRWTGHSDHSAFENHSTLPCPLQQCASRLLLHTPVSVFDIRH